MVLRLNLESKLFARYLVFKEPPRLGEPDQNTEKRPVRQALFRSSLLSDVLGVGYDGVTGTLERYDNRTVNIGRPPQPVKKA